MVEGPKVVIKAKKLQVFVGQIIQYFFIFSNGEISDKSATEIIHNRLITKIFCVGKELFFILDDGVGIRIHFGMNGNERICRNDSSSSSGQEGYPTLKDGKVLNKLEKFQLKIDGLIICNKNKLYLHHSTITIKSTSYWNRIELNLSCDVMSNKFNINEVLTKLSNDKRSIYEAIMHQWNMPGVGNIIKCEGLFHSKIHPYSLPHAIPLIQLTELINNLQQFAWKWHDDCVKRRKTEYDIYGRMDCKVCHSKISLIRSGQLARITYFCSVCQLKYDHPVTVSNSTSDPRIPIIQNQPSPPIQPILHPPTLTPITWSCSFCGYCNTLSPSIPSDACYCNICGEIKTSNDIIQPPKDIHPIEIDTNPQQSIDPPFKPNQGIDKPFYFDLHNNTLHIQVNYLIHLKCKCHQLARLQRVRKEGSNLNRLFWGCSQNKYKQCSFFEWADHRFPICCNNTHPRTILRRVLKDSVNNGRFFFCCPSAASTKSKGTGGAVDQLPCNYFQWVNYKEVITDKNLICSLPMITSIIPQIIQDHKENISEVEQNSFKRMKMENDVIIPKDRNIFLEMIKSVVIYHDLFAERNRSPTIEIPL